MFKWVSWVIRMGATALLLSFLCIWTTGYIVNSYMETVIKQLDLPLKTQPFALSGVWGTLWGADEAPKKEASASQSNLNKEADIQDNAEEPTQSPEPGEEASSSPEDKEAVASPDLEGEDAVASPRLEEVEASSSPEVADNEDSTPVLGGQAEMEQLTTTERQALYAMVVSKLNQDQLKLLSDALQEGLTADELVQVQNMLKTVLTDEEYSEMIKVLEGKKANDSNH